MSATASISGGIALLQTGIPGFDLLTMGGLPKNRTTLVSGTAGSAKTVFATQFLAEGIRQADEPCVFVTLEESPDDIRSNMLSLGWDIARWEADAMWVFVDGSPPVEQEETLIGDYDLGGLLARIQAAVAKIGAKRLAMDAIGALFMRFGDIGKIRSELLHISRALRQMQVTSVMSSERIMDYGEIGRYGVEEFVADNVIILRNVLDAELRRRTLEILKMRGVSHRHGEFPFVVINGRGIEVVPLSAIPLAHKSSSVRVAFGNAGLDRMCNGGPFRDSTTLVSGPTGSGKTLMATEFAAGAASSGERCLFLCFEESRDQLVRNAAAWGRDFAQMEADGLLRFICENPEAASLEDRLIRIKDIVGEFQPHRIVLDSLTSLRRIASEKSLRDFVFGLTAFIKQAQIPALFTATIEPIVGAATVTEIHATMFTDSIILLRYVEIGGQIHHSVTVLKMRGSRHETEIREFTIDDKGMHIGLPFHQVRGVLTGSGQPEPAGNGRAAQGAVRKGKQ
jgi:circadian clock protein KaiC